MKKTVFLISASLVLAVTQLHAQTEQSKKIVVYYPFEGVKSVQEITALDNDIKQLINVTDSKTEYKTGKTTAQLQVWVTYPTHTKESDKVFTPALLKRLLIEKGYTPAQPRQIDITTTQNGNVSK